MALTVQDANLVWQKVKIATANANPAAQNALAELKKYLAGPKRNPNLQFIPFTAEQAVTNLGTSLSIGASKIFAVYMKGRRTSGTTASFFAIHDAADNSASTTTTVSQKFNVTGQEAVYVNPNGFQLTTEAVVSAATAIGGATESSAADACDGFVIAGA